MLQSHQQIGNLDRRITFIEKITEEGDSNEDKIIGWQEVSTNPTVSASKNDLQGYEAVISDRLTYVQPCDWMVRFEDGKTKTTQMRLVYETRVYEIMAITEPNGQRKRFLEIKTKLLDNDYFP